MARRRSNQQQTDALGMDSSKAASRLRKLVMLDLVQRLGLDTCYRCTLPITLASDLSLDHMAAWLSAVDPPAAFWDLGNIAFSHWRCNILEGGARANASKTECKRGHEYNEKNTRITKRGTRQCRACNNQLNKIKYHARKTTQWKQPQKS